MEYSMLIISLASGVSALVGSIISVLLSNRLSSYRIELLEKKSEKIKTELDDLKQLKVDIAEIKVQINNIISNMKGE